MIEKTRQRAPGKHLFDPRQKLALSYYTDPVSETFSNLKQSMIRAGYDDEYANSIGGQSPIWLTEGIKNTVDLVQASEKNLKRYAQMTVDLDSPKGIDLAKLQTDVSKFVLKNLARGKYSESKEDKIPEINVKIVQYGGTVTDVEVDGVIEGEA